MDEKYEALLLVCLAVEPAMRKPFCAKHSASCARVRLQCSPHRGATHVQIFGLRWHVTQSRAQLIVTTAIGTVVRARSRAEKACGIAFAT